MVRRNCRNRIPTIATSGGDTIGVAAPNDVDAVLSTPMSFLRRTFTLAYLAIVR